MTEWTSQDVKRELAQAFRVLFSVPVRDAPLSTGAGFWPDHTYERDEVDEQRRQAITENRPRLKVRYGPRDIQKMETILLGTHGEKAWLVRFLSDQPGARRCLTRWAIWSAQDRNVKRECRLRGWAYSTFRRRRDQGAQLLADALNQAQVELR